jgi:hypothetical protein
MRKTEQELEAVFLTQRLTCVEKSQLHSTLEASALNLRAAFENSVAESCDYNTENNLEGPSAKSYAIILLCTESLT